MGYIEALTAAGAAVHADEYFGSYQGDWLARVTYKGKTGYVWGSFGSCGGCDAFDAEFDYNNTRGWCDEHSYNAQPLTCKACKVESKKYKKALAEFGKRYLSNLLPDSTEIRAYFNKNRSWDSDAQEVIDWLDKQENVA